METKINNAGNNGNCCMGMEGNGNKDFPPVELYLIWFPHSQVSVVSSWLCVVDVQACNRLTVCSKAVCHIHVVGLHWCYSDRLCTNGLSLCQWCSVYTSMCSMWWCLWLPRLFGRTQLLWVYCLWLRSNSKQVIECFHSDVIICLRPSLIASNVNHNSKVSNVLEVDSDAKVR